ncbi:unnamed protein product [Caenorhabditis bovis]|uniref:ZP domain-containing protein n=1 Tax=Caenorhabditis bovis TaxID=2654633 RepID=A0A8S1EX03_9PELO|nr:unnamed protein product [Caenorhabditis bovis]
MRYLFIAFLSFSAVFANDEPEQCPLGFTYYPKAPLKCMGVFEQVVTDNRYAETICWRNEQSQLARTENLESRKAIVELFNSKCLEPICRRACVVDELLPPIAGFEQIPYYVERLNRFPNGFEPVRMSLTEPVQHGDTLHILMRVYPGSIEQFELADGLLIRKRDSLKMTRIQQPIHLIFYYKYPEEPKKEPRTKLIIKHGTFEASLEDKITVPWKKSMNGSQLFDNLNVNIEGKLEMSIHLGEKEITVNIPNVLEKEYKYNYEFRATRFYFIRHVQQNEIMDIYFTRGNCKKAVKGIEPVVNCNWMPAPVSIPVLRCSFKKLVMCARRSSEEIKADSDKFAYEKEEGMWDIIEVHSRTLTPIFLGVATVVMVSNIGTLVFFFFVKR